MFNLNNSKISNKIEEHKEKVNESKSRGKQSETVKSIESKTKVSNFVPSRPLINVANFDQSNKNIQIESNQMKNADNEAVLKANGGQKSSILDKLVKPVVLKPNMKGKNDEDECEIKLDF